MKTLGRMSAGVLLLLLAALAPTNARQREQEKKDKPQQDKPERQQQQKTKPQQEQRSSKPHQQQHAQQQQQNQNKNRQQQRHPQQASRSTQPRQRVQHTEQRQVWQQHRAQNWQSEHRDWQQRGGYHGYRIPQDRYRRYFGPGHSFRVFRYPFELYGGSPRFQYGGFWFGFMDPYPEYWSDDWYDNDDVYVDFTDGGYYLYNRRYPRDRIAISVNVN
jgi:hypothetical protein